MESVVVEEVAGASVSQAPAPGGLRDLSSDRSSRDELTNPSLKLRHVACSKSTFLLLWNILALGLCFDTKATAWQSAVTFGLALPAQEAYRLASRSTSRIVFRPATHEGGMQDESLAVST